MDRTTFHKVMLALTIAFGLAVGVLALVASGSVVGTFATVGGIAIGALWALSAFVGRSGKAG